MHTTTSLRLPRLDQGSYSGSSVPPVATTMQTQVSHGPVTYFFSSAQKVGFYPDGQPFVVSNIAAFNVTQITPDGVLLNGFDANGAMINPFFPVGPGQVQGFDGMFGSVGDGTGVNLATVTPYSVGVNVDPVFKGAPIVVAKDSEMSIVKSVRGAGVTQANVWRICDWWGVLHVVKTVPLQGCPAPSACSISKNMDAYAGKRNKNVLNPGYTYQASQPTLAQCLANAPAGVDGQAKAGTTYFNASFKPYFGQGAEQRRRFMIETFGYSRDYCKAWADYALAMHAEGPVNCSDAAFDAFLAAGSQVLGMCDRQIAGGYAQNTGGAGQNLGAQLVAMFFGAAYSSVPGVAAKALAVPGNERGQPRMITAASEGIRVQYSGAPNHSIPHATFTADHVGRPRWVKGETWSATEPQLDAQIDSDYENSSSPAAFPSLLAMMLLRNWTGGVDGATAMLEGGPYDNTNQKAAPIAQLDIWRTITNVHSLLFVEFRHLAVYDAVRDLCSLARWQDAPSEFTPLVANQAAFLSSVVGGFQWNLTTAAHATQTITAYQIQYSLDQVSWYDVDTPGVSGTQTGLANGVKYYVRWRRQSAKGWSPWSLNYKYKSTDPTERLVVVTGGAAGGAITNTQAPAVFQPKYPKWEGPLYTPAPATLDLTQGVFVVAGVGLWTGNLTAGAIIAHQRNGVDIPGASAAKYNLVGADKNTSHRVGINYGSGFVYSAAVNVPNQYLQNPVQFDGVNDRYQYTNLAAQVPHSTGATCSFWFELTANGARRYLCNIPGIFIEKAADNTIRVVITNSSSVIIWDVKSVDTFSMSDGRVHVMASYNGAAGVGYVAINGVILVADIDPELNKLNTTVAPVAGTIGTGLAVTGTFGGRTTDHTLDLNGKLSDVWFDNSFIDISNPVTLAKWWNNGLPPDLGANGQLPTGVAPKIYLGDNMLAADWNAGANRGSAALTFTMIGAVT